MTNKCQLVEQGFSQGSCLVSAGGKRDFACQTTLKWEGNIPLRLIKSAHLSRPEHYFSIYQSGCNLSCKKCHSFRFTKYASGEWLSPEDIADLAREYASEVTVKEPRERATNWHAHDLCLGCGWCVLRGIQSERCPRKLKPEQIVLSPQGFGPARNIIAFTGGDLACQPQFYMQAAEAIKGLSFELWVLFETNGYGLTKKNLKLFKDSGIDTFWLDIKAYDAQVHRRLTGVSNELILKLPYEILARGFVLEVLSLYIPGWVETDQIERIASLLASVDPEIPFTILAFFPEYQLVNTPSPNLKQMLGAYDATKSAGLKQVRLGNLSQFIRTEEDYEALVKHIGQAEL